MKVPGIRSPHDKVGGLVYFGRMLDKMCAHFLRVPYAEIAAHVKGGTSDEDTLAWCRARGHQFTEDDAFAWNEFLRKRGWNDNASERLKQRKAESELSSCDDIRTLFDYIDADEERPLRTQPWQP